MILHDSSCVLIEGHNFKHEHEIECTFHTY